MRTSAESQYGNVDLVERVRAAMQSVPYQQLRQIECSCEGEAVVLGGDVDSFFLKQMAQSVVLSVAGVSQVLNNVHVTS